MKILIKQPLAFSEIGQRTNNEDALFPSLGQSDLTTSLFLVCDGMGGADKGEEASRLLCQGIVEYYEKQAHPIFDGKNLENALTEVYSKYICFMKQNSLINRMGSTLTLLQFHKEGVTAAHIGDSRIYQFRQGKIIFQTKDHKQVNEMYEAGVITEEQAKTHPWRNKLSKAVVAYNDGNEANRRKHTPDIKLLEDICENDCFFLCTDGVLEQMDNHSLEQLMGEKESDSHLLEVLLNKCKAQTKDNYSGYFIQVQKVINHE